jgi:hypothetical protein
MDCFSRTNLVVRIARQPSSGVDQSLVRTLQREEIASTASPLFAAIFNELLLSLRNSCGAARSLCVHS